MEFLITDVGLEVKQVIGREPNEDEMQMVYQGDYSITRYRGNRFELLVVDSIADEDEEDSETEFNWKPINVE